VKSKNEGTKCDNLKRQWNVGNKAQYQRKTKNTGGEKHAYIQGGWGEHLEAWSVLQKDEALYENLQRNGTIRRFKNQLANWKDSKTFLYRFPNENGDWDFNLSGFQTNHYTAKKAAQRCFIMGKCYFCEEASPFC